MIIFVWTTRVCQKSSLIDHSKIEIYQNSDTVYNVSPLVLTHFNNNGFKLF